MRVHILGAGTVGRLVERELVRRGHHASVQAMTALDRRTLALSLRKEPVGALVVAGGPSGTVREVVVPAAVEAGVPIVDASFDPAHLRALDDTWHERAAAAGVPIVSAAGWAFLLGDLLGAVAARGSPGTEEVHVAYALPRRRDLLGAWTAGARLAVTDALASGMTVRRDGEVAEEGAGETRRLAWFPRPVGPHHAAGIPGTEALTLPRHVPGLRTVRTYLAVPSMGAEVLQAGARSLRRAGGDGRVASLIARLPVPTEARRAGLRWACVAEAPADAGTSRAWAYGTDPYVFAAAAMVLVAERVSGGATAGGLRSPGELGEPAALLDEVTLRADARWSAARP